MSSKERSVLIVDNYDSFTYIIREYLGRAIGFERVGLVKNDNLCTEEILQYGALIISPGPGLPSESGDLQKLLELAVEKMPVLGICLGHQAIAELAGAKLLNLGDVRHGHQLRIQWLADCAISPEEKFMKVGLYHSWVVDTNDFPDALEILAQDDEGQIMALKYKDRPVFGVQFHPESILTESGSEIIFHFLSVANLV